MNSINLLEKLEKVKNFEEKEDLSSMVSFDLQENGEFYKNQIESHFHSYLQSLNSQIDSFKSDLFKLRIEIYTDTDYLEKLALGLSFLPDRRVFTEEDEENLMDSIESEVFKLNLEIILNDISVNSKQRLLEAVDGRE